MPWWNTSSFIIVEEECLRVQGRGWAEMANWRNVLNCLEFGTCPFLQHYEFPPVCGPASSPTVPWWTGLSITSSLPLSAEDLLRLTSSHRNSCWIPRLRRIIFHDFLLEQEGRVGLIFGVFLYICGWRGVFAHEQKLANYP